MAVILAITGGVVLLFLITALRGAPYVPTHRSSLSILFDELLPVSEKDLVVDIGSGDGVVLRAAAQRGARALGYELNPVLVGISKALSIRYGMRVTIRFADFWLVEFPPETTVVYTFGETRDIVRMYQKVANEAVRLQKTIHFVSYAFTIDGVTPIRSKHAMNVYRVSPSSSSLQGE